MPEIRVLKERCVACGDCVALCPQSGAGLESSVLVLDDGQVSVSGADGCIGCFTCVEFCRAAAIVISGSAPGSQSPGGLYPSRPTSRII
ncbi:MAG: indolepyruvate ferredoxin oxidoreductase subunit alpha [Candidatus Geothermincolia bacterium]